MFRFGGVKRLFIRKISFFVFLFILIVLSSCSAQKTYIALGDSIASGYGLDKEDERYPSVLFEKLKKDGYVDEHHNFAVSGYTTRDVLNQLNSMTKEEKKLFRNAKLVTINIGGNNLLQPFLEYAKLNPFIKGNSRINRWINIFLDKSGDVMIEIGTGMKNAVDDTKKQNDLDNIYNRGKIIFSGIGDKFREFKDSFDKSPGLVDVIKGDIPPELKLVLDEGTLTFADEFELIIKWLEKNAPKSTIMVNLVFNPIPNEILAIPVPLSSFANDLIESINKTILEESKKRDFLVVDVYTNFQNRPDLIKFNINILNGRISFDPIHPNAKGHRFIADLNYSAYEKYMHDTIPRRK